MLRTFPLGVLLSVGAACMAQQTPLADREHYEAQKHADAMAHHRAGVVASIIELERSRDELLDRLAAEL